MIELKCFGLTKRSIKGMACDLDIKNGLVCPLLLQQGRGAWKWLLYVPSSSNEVAQDPSYFGSKSKEIHENIRRKMFCNI
jgi:hypothetical protein